ncbi:MAG: phosphate ABC transporter permease subunit PstC [Acidobacteria bacterium]|nr:phosphate ABC transporter permease subunit PstC [Acidobacteriota bacterium]
MKIPFSKKERTLFEVLSFFSAVVVFVIIFIIFGSLVFDSLPAMKIFGLKFLAGTKWDPVKDTYGALPQIYGTLVTSIFAIVIAFPIGILTAFFLTEISPPSLSRPVSIGVELLAAVPSIIYGMWGLFVLAPIISKKIFIPLKEKFPDSIFLEGPPMGIGIFTASIILAIMVLPLIVSICRELLLLVPNMVRESAYAIGATKAEVSFGILLPYAKKGIIGATFLALGRALGETMAVTFVIGNQHKISASIVAPSSTIASTLANELSEAVTRLHVSSLIFLGLVLFFLSITVISLSKYLIYTAEKTAKTRK